jgi:hypothetical protein
MNNSSNLVALHPVGVENTRALDRTRRRRHDGDSGETQNEEQ